ncbi:unnamed protein product [Phytomonas sp. Hart1]|nr:unnamed protein product [Phytomonas sp. Hart1]|eukprot:CCW70106.1 unnamed protein product [Phytomonas sp. isolate Hart1]
MKRFENGKGLNVNRGPFWRQLVWKCLRLFLVASDVNSAHQREVDGDVNFAQFYFYPNQWPQSNEDAILLSDNIFQDYLNAWFQWVVLKLVQTSFIIYVISIFLG